MYSLFQKLRNNILKSNIRKRGSFREDTNMKQLQMVNKSKKLIEEDSLDLDEYESDFSTVSKSHKDFEKDFEAYKVKEKYKIVKRKYFNEVTNNFLTWSEKQQIKYLHAQDPQEWSSDKLSESFPSDEAGISKILKANWRINNPKRVINHDKSVETNWKLLKQGKINNLQPELKNHLLSFSNRINVVKDEAQYLPTEHLKSNMSTEFKSNEFKSIITSYVEKSNVKSQTTLLQKTVNTSFKPKKEMYLNDNEGCVNKSPHMTLNSLKSELLKKSAQGSSVDKEDETLLENKMVEHTNETIHQNFEKEQNITFLTPKTKIKETQLHTYIVIPKHLWKKGRTYKTDDCYFDDDGQFLYRVPGMKNT